MASISRTKLLAAGAVTTTACIYLATQSRGTQGALRDSLAANVAKGAWARTFVVSVPVSKIAKVGPEFAQPVAGSNTYTVHTDELFKRYAHSILDSESFRNRCEGISNMKSWQKAEQAGNDDADALSPSAALALPKHAAGLEVEATGKGEVLLRERGTGLRLWMGVREVKPKWVGDQHSVEYCYAPVLDPDQVSGFLDYVLYWVDIWQSRRVINEGARTTSNKQMSFIVKYNKDK